MEYPQYIIITTPNMRKNYQTVRDIFYWLTYLITSNRPLADFRAGGKSFPSTVREIFFLLYLVFNTRASSYII